MGNRGIAERLILMAVLVAGDLVARIEDMLLWVGRRRDRHSRQAVKFPRR